MPPKKRNSGTTQSKEPKSVAESGSAERKESPELALKKYDNLCFSVHFSTYISI